MATPRMACLLLAAASSAALGAKVHSTARAAMHAALDMSFEDFLVKHSRSYSNSSEEYSERMQLFELRKEAARRQNSRPDALWVATVNKFSDLRAEELRAMHGYKPSAKGKGLSFAEEEEDHTSMKASLPEQVDWRPKLQDAKTIVEQGGCGSCWAISAATILNAHHEIFRGKAAKFSAQEMVNCVPNPDECGGQGGCSGATVELGIDWAVKNGISQESAVPYAASDGKCAKSLLQGLRGAGGGAGGSAIGLTGFRVLPRNKMEPLMKAVAEQGPVAVSVAADNWFSYYKGVFDSCDNVVNHAVTLYGYGRMDTPSPDEGLLGGEALHNQYKWRHSQYKYWLVKNSWGSDWGENGFIRILRHEDENTYCGIDDDPSKGIACKKGPTQMPSQVTVCGTCGILYDSVVPEFEATTAKQANFLDIGDSVESSETYEEKLADELELDSYHQLTEEALQSRSKKNPF